MTYQSFIFINIIFFWPIPFSNMQHHRFGTINYGIKVLHKNMSDYGLKKYPLNSKQHHPPQDIFLTFYPWIYRIWLIIQVALTFNLHLKYNEKHHNLLSSTHTNLQPMLFRCERCTITRVRVLPSSPFHHYIVKKNEPWQISRDSLTHKRSTLSHFLVRDLSMPLT